MKQIFYILSLVILSLAMSSCAKDEIESPSESNEGVKALVIDEMEFQNGKIIPITGESQGHFIVGEDGDGEILINDDGDEEDEERSSTN